MSGCAPEIQGSLSTQGRDSFGKSCGKPMHFLSDAKSVRKSLVDILGGKTETWQLESAVTNWHLPFRHLSALHFQDSFFTLYTLMVCTHVSVCLQLTNIVGNCPRPCDTGSPHLLNPANPIQSASVYFALSSSSLMACAWDGHITQHVQWPQMKAQNKNTSSDSSAPEKVSGPCGNMLFKGAFHLSRWYTICTT